MTEQEINETYERCKKLMWERFRVTPENIDRKLEELYQKNMKMGPAVQAHTKLVKKDMRITLITKEMTEK